MTINGRLLLLVVATGLFVRVWTANDRAHNRNHRRMAPQVEQAVAPPNPGHYAVARTVAYRPISSSRSTPSLEETWTFSSCPVPLPAGIQCGIYRVVNDTGRVARLEFAPPVSKAQHASSPLISSEFYVAAIGSQRWYFIRLQMPDNQVSVLQEPEMPSDDAALMPSASNIQSPCSNRKFDFTGYVTTNNVDDPAGGELAFPEPPDLPVPQ